MEEWTINTWKEKMKNHEVTAFYLYTPFCGTCKVASKMLEVIEELLPNIPIGKADINFLEDFAFEQKIESVPCLIITKNGEIREKIYAFKSVPNLYEKLTL
ncbi:thioredoxin family protein [Ureibacillus sp. FSL K6-8385]|uniref:Thioredoxin family protein n=1 Tax=Ureibacillus terrenus TaxID=118246 RepID=A0A540V0N9_9BACL|nr:thioredoxin family protein [Ureibacillus terrenus]MED3662362.1 thioredoxin family protein [Ureibacillus terrenus]MED3763245.1 thioredoxin family protein [Ureibacillus terrenus]TQE90301.1 thioredoxin family protein [Ureibacillus terrenus]